MMVFDYKKIKDKTGIDFENFGNSKEYENEQDALYYIIKHLEFLESHNKNYTKEQYNKIIDLLDIIKAIKIKELTN